MPSDTATATMLRATLTMREPSCCREIGACSVRAPDRPGVAPDDKLVRVGHVQCSELICERRVLQPVPICRARVEPEIGTDLSQPGRRVSHEKPWIVRGQELETPSEDRVQLVGTHVPRPALDDRELARMLNRDVDRAITALRAARHGASMGGGNR